MQIYSALLINLLAVYYFFVSIFLILILTIVSVDINLNSYLLYKMNFYIHIAITVLNQIWKILLLNVMEFISYINIL